MRELHPDQIRRAIVEHTRRLAEAAVAAGPDAPVPTASDWTVAGLVEHVGQTQHWIADIIERRVADPSQLSMEMVVVPTDPGEWEAWMAASAQGLVDACSDDALVAPVWNASGDDRTGGQFWMTTVVNETVVHGFDAAIAAGRSPVIEPAVAAALVTNHFAMLTSPTWAMQRAASADAIRGTGQVLRWLATDAADGEGEWSIERGPDGAVRGPGAGSADVTVTGPAGSILLVLTRRLPLGEAPDLRIEGDVDLAQHWIENTAHVSG